MSKHLKSCEGVAKIRDLISLLRDTNHGAFPVVNIAGNVVGMIPRNFLFVLIEHHMFYDAAAMGVQGNKVSFHYTAISSFYDKRPSPYAEFDKHNDEPRVTEGSSFDMKTSPKEATKPLSGQVEVGQSLEQPFLQNTNSLVDPLKINES